MPDGERGLTREDRHRIARARLVKVTRSHGAALLRTLEQKISDAGPFNQRVNPHILTPAKAELLEQGVLHKIRAHNVDWYALHSTPEEVALARIEEQATVLHLIDKNLFRRRIGQALEIATFRALRETNYQTFGGFHDLTDEPSTKLLSKEEPPSIIKRRRLAGGRKLDFIIECTGIYAGVEVKNVREWLYPDREEVRQLLQKSIELDLPPVLIARRIPFVTRYLLQQVGMLVWETRHQLYPAEYANVAPQVRHKRSLGYFDIQVTDFPDANLTDFIARIIPAELPTARAKFDAHTDLITEFAYGTMTYHEFAARVRRRRNRLDEDGRDEGFMLEPEFPEEPPF